MIIRIDQKTPSVNQLYWHRGNMKIMKTPAKELREDIKKLVPEHKWTEDTKLMVTVRIHENWICKNGSIRKVDIMNKEKFLVDSVFASWPDIDDKQIFWSCFEKIESDEEYAEVIVMEYDETSV